ncbi:MAG: hypothetical protein QOH63_2644 [Acidobacteriota bacterium]|jgi:hypothetical protein|nr:hypothetical protein [Acidobacteriota bacterium]
MWKINLSHLLAKLSCNLRFECYNPPRHKSLAEKL